MTKEEINANKALFLTAQETLPNLVEHLADLRERAARSGKGTGWIINGLKGKIKQVRKQTFNEDGQEPHRIYNQYYKKKKNVEG